MQSTTPSGARRIWARTPSFAEKRAPARSTSLRASIVSTMYWTVRSNSFSLSARLLPISHMSRRTVSSRTAAHAGGKELQRLHPVPDAQRGPAAAAVVPCAMRRLQRAERRLLVQPGFRPQGALGNGAGAVLQADRRRAPRRSSLPSCAPVRPQGSGRLSRSGPPPGQNRPRRAPCRYAGKMSAIFFFILRAHEARWRLAADVPERFCQRTRRRCCRRMRWHSGDADPFLPTSRRLRCRFRWHLRRCPLLGSATSAARLPSGALRAAATP